MEPAAQGEQRDDAAAVDTAPKGQSVHSVEPVALAKVPGGHVSGWDAPAGHQPPGGQGPPMGSGPRLGDAGAAVLLPARQ